MRTIRLAVLGVALLAVGCRFQAKAPPGIDFPRKTVAWTALTTYPVRIDDRFIASRSPTLPQEVAYGPFLDITYRVGWRFAVDGPVSTVSDSQCEAKPTGDVFLHGRKVARAAMSCTPQRPGGLWLVLEERCRKGVSGYGTGELAFEAVHGEYGMHEGHFVFRRGADVVAAIEIFTSPGNQGVWQRDGSSIEERATVAFTTNALEWFSESAIRGRICGL